MSNLFETVFSGVKKAFEAVFLHPAKVGQVAAVVIKDAPAVAKQMEPFWAASLKVAAAVGTVIDEKGINIPADSQAYQDIKAWLPQFKSMSAAWETAYGEVEAIINPPATTVAPLPPSAPPLPPPVAK